MTAKFVLFFDVTLHYHACGNLSPIKNQNNQLKSKQSILLDKSCSFSLKVGWSCRHLNQNGGRAVWIINVLRIKQALYFPRCYFKLLCKSFSHTKNTTIFNGFCVTGLMSCITQLSLKRWRKKNNEDKTRLMH